MGVSVGGVLRQRSAYFRRGRMAREMFGWQPVSNVMEGCGTVSAGHGALQLHPYLVHCIAYAGPLTWSPQIRQTTRGAVIPYPRLREASWLATVVSLAHIAVVGWHRRPEDGSGDCELTQGVNLGQERGFDSRPVWVGWDGMASVVDGRRGVAGRTKINRTKTAHNTCICGHLGLVPIHIHTRSHRCVDTG